MNKAEPIDRATALDYKEAGTARVVAQGSGVMARNIAELAQRHNVLVLQDFTLSERLSQVPVGTRIPDKVFAALSVVLDFLEREDERAATGPVAE